MDQSDPIVFAWLNERGLSISNNSQPIQNKRNPNHSNSFTKERPENDVENIISPSQCPPFLFC